LPKTKRSDRKGARLQNDKGLEAFKKEQHEQGLQFFLTAYQLDAGDVEVVNNVGMAYLKTGNLPEAARY
jgi:Flp pilus assembly protein TadD